jgi:hypothetical protein
MSAVATKFRAQVISIEIHPDIPKEERAASAGKQVRPEFFTPAAAGARR